MKPTKFEAQYRFPEQCCALCKHAYLSTYGDAQCLVLEAGNCIDYGAVCNLFEREVEHE